MTDEDPSAEEELDPPTPSRVAARSLVMAAVTCRAFIEKDAGNADQFWADALHWLDRLEIGGEVEAWEREILDTPLGQLGQRSQIDAQWLSEGLAVVAWALGRYALPDYDAQVTPAKVANCLGFLGSIEQTVLQRPTLKPQTELLSFRESMFSLHWRIREFKLNAQALDFADFAKTAWFGPLSLDGLRLVENDLAIGDQPISKTRIEDISLVLSTAQERHRAINWLVGESAIYSETETST